MPRIETRVPEMATFLDSDGDDGDFPFSLLRAGEHAHHLSLYLPPSIGAIGVTSQQDKRDISVLSHIALLPFSRFLADQTQRRAIHKDKVPQTINPQIWYFADLRFADPIYFVDLKLTQVCKYILFPYKYVQYFVEICEL
jgi:hypothetical protein